MADVDTDDVAYVAGLVRAHDRPRYYATLFAPRALRPDLFAIYGFAAEIARVPDQVSESALGEMRLQWWGDALAEATAGARGADSPALRAIVRTISKHLLPVAPFEALVEARVADLYADPPSTLADLEGRLGETESALFQMAAIVAGSDGKASADAAGHAGIAYGLARRLAALPVERARGRTILPARFLADAGLVATDVFAAEPPEALGDVVARILAVARSHLASARAAVAELRGPVRTVFLPLAIVDPLLRRMPRARAGAMEPAALSDLAMLSRIAAARVTGLG